MVELEILQKIALEILEAMPYKPFLCLPMTALLYANLKDRHNFYGRMITGNLKFNEQYLFKQDFDIPTSSDKMLQSWSGHAWYEIDDLICDLSFFRTIYSENFTKPCRAELIKLFGEQKGCLIAPRVKMKEVGLIYEEDSILDDEKATAIISGIKQLPIWS